MKMKVLNKSGNELPMYKTAGSAGMDLRAFLPDGPVYLQPGEIKLIGTGLHLELPEGYEAQLRPRSGLALKQGLTLVNSPGTVDADFRGEVGIPLINHSATVQKIENGDRICQMIIAAYTRVELEVVESFEELSETERGAGGFGHTGKN